MTLENGVLIKLADKIILDTGSTISGTIMNPDFVTNVQPASRPITMSTNAGSKRMTVEGTVPGFGPVYFDDTQMANIFSFSSLADKYRITYDSTKEDAFCVHMDHRVLKFHRTNEGLYAYQPDQKFLDQVARDKNMLSPAPATEARSFFDMSTHQMGFAQTVDYSSDDDSDDESVGESIAPSHQEGEIHPSGGDLNVEEEHVDFEPQQDDVESPSPRYPKRNQ